MATLLWLGWLAWLSTSAPVYAQTAPTSCIVTTRGGADVLDVVFQLECSSIESVGAMHYEVQSVGGPSSRDRELEIEFLLSPTSEGRFATVHRQTIELKEGATSARGLLPFVVNNAGDAAQQRLQFWNVGVYEEGREIEGSRTLQATPGAQYLPVRLAAGERPPFMVHQRGAQTGAVLHILDSGEKFNATLSFQATAHVIKDPNSLTISTVPLFDLSHDFMRAINVRHIESAPEYWHYYLQFNAVRLDSQTFGALLAKRPLAADALKQYVAAGGDLILTSNEADGPLLIDQWLNRAGKGHDPADWTTDGNAFPVPTPSAAEITFVEETVATPVDEIVKADQPSEPWVFKRLAVRTYVRGRLICIKNFYSNANSLPAAASRMAVGVSASSVHDESWSLRNMIASVGKPPVWTFCAIILLFGLILGPGLLILTAWIGRRSLLILLVPLVSIGATLSIVTYEIVHEGFGTHARISSVLSIDERSGDGFVWSRQNYFSGWPAREGLSIPSNIYFRPVGISRIGRSGVPRTTSDYQYSVHHTPEAATFRGVLQAREQKQFLIGHPAKLTMPIQVKRIDGKRVSLRNLTDESLPFVVLRDGAEGYYFAENVAPKAELELNRMPFGDIAGTLSRLRTELTPSLPAELRAMGWGAAPDQSGVEILDQEWIGAMAEQSSQSTIKPYGFVTLIRQCSAVYMPLKANTSESLHLVKGSALW